MNSVQQKHQAPALPKSKSKQSYNPYGNISQQQAPIQPHDNSEYIIESLKQSQIESANEYVRSQCNPMILSNTHNMRSNLDKMLMLRMRNVVSELKEKYIQIVQYIQNQRIILHQYLHYVINQIQTHCIKIHAKQQVISLYNHTNKHCQSSKNAQRNQQISNKLKVENHYEDLIKQLQEKIHIISDDNEKLMIQNQCLQEYIFDMEQRIVGVDLQVEKKVKEMSRQIALKYKNGNSQNNGRKDQNNNNEVIIRQLKEQIDILQKKCRYIQSLSSKQGELKELQLSLSDKRVLLQRQRDELYDLKHRLQKQKDQSYQRQHQILIAEQNLSKKIFQIKKKQTQLSLWQSQLTKKASQNQKIQNQQMKRPYVAEHLKYRSQPFQESNFESGKEIDEISLKSFGKNNKDMPNDVLLSPKTQEEFVYSKNLKIQSPEQGHLPMNHKTREIVKQIKDYNLNRSQQSRLKVQTQYSIGNSQAQGNRFMQRGLQRNITSPYHQIRETVAMNNRNNSIQYNHNIGSRVNSPFNNNFLEQSKHSRASAVKSIKGVYPPPSLKVSSPKGGESPITGLGSKLQRLREQIKRQIDSIK